jgi:hypothetical protein
VLRVRRAGSYCGKIHGSRSTRSTICSYAADSKAQNKTHNFFRPGKVRLGHVKRHIQEKRSMYVLPLGLEVNCGPKMVGTAALTARCYASWQMDGRGFSNDHSRNGTTRARTRRIRIHCTGPSFEDSYIALVAPFQWTSEGRFLGRPGSTFVKRHMHCAKFSATRDPQIC